MNKYSQKVQAKREDIMSYKDVSLSPEERARDLIKLMTLEEKIIQLATSFPNAVKRLGIPNMQQGECLHGIKEDEATTFPQAIGMGATWNPELIERVASVIARECRAEGVHQVHTPMLGVIRDPRWGRAQEGYGEDPCLVSEIGLAFVNGLQGRGSERFGHDKVISTVKHYVGDAEPLSGNNGAAVEISERQLREVHLVPFEKTIVEGKAGGVMPAHHSLNGVPCHMNKHVLVDILRDEYGFDGVIISDNGDIRMLYTGMGVAESMEDAAKKALEAGVDTELAWLCPMGKNRAYSTPLLAAVRRGDVSEELVDKSVFRVLVSKFRLGLFDDEEELEASKHTQFFEFQGDTTGDTHIHYADTNRSFGIKRKNYREVLYSEESNKLALEAALNTITLLKNDGNILPLDKNKIKKIAVVGPNADTCVLGNYATRKPRYFVSVLDGIREYVGENTEVTYVKGCDPEGFAALDIEKAAEASRDADVVIAVCGGNESTCKENQDVDNLNLPGDQEKLLKDVYAANKNVVLILLHGRANSIVWEKENIPAILEGWFLGQETGHATAKVLFGEYCPGGKLPVSVPRCAGQCPVFYNKLPFGRKQNYYKSDATPLFPFGYGLSYTTFDISEPYFESTTVKNGEPVHVFVKVKNTGDCDGDEVVQIYIHDVVASVTRPCKELKAFKRVHLKKGEERELEFTLTPRDLSFYLDDKWVCENGKFEIMAGNSSDNTKTVVIEII